MLVLTRRIGETIKIGEDITVIITGMVGETVSIGIEAPKAVKIYRGNLYDFKVRRGELPPRKGPNASATETDAGGKEDDADDKGKHPR